jgi:hypothetical protein
VIAEVARRHDLAPQQLSNWIKAAKDGRFALPADATLSFVPVVVEPVQANKSAPECRGAVIEVVIGLIKVRVPVGADILASLIETAKLSGIDPQAWLTDVLTRLVNLWPSNRLDELLPWMGAEAHQQQ